MEGMYRAGPNSGVILKLEWLLCFYAPGFAATMFQMQDDFAIQERKDRSPGGPCCAPTWHEYAIHAEFAGWYLPGLAACFRIRYKNGRSSHQLQFRKFNEIRNEGCGMIGKSGPGVFRGEYEHTCLAGWCLRPLQWPGSYHQMNNGLCRYAS